MDLAKLEIDHEIEARYGRNVLRFQMMERNLKTYLGRYSLCLHGKSMETLAVFDKAGQIQMSTLGMLVNSFIDRFESKDEPAEFFFTISVGDSSELQEKRPALIRDMKTLVDERNGLVHHFIPELIELSGNTKSLLSMLDEQFTRIDKVNRELSEYIDIVTSSWKSFFQDKRMLDTFIKSALFNEPLVHLAELSLGSIELDNWVPLSLAGRALRQLNSKLLDELMIDRNVKNLKDLLLTYSEFECKEMANQREKVEWYYRYSHASN
ncbi:MAG: hypothetical protein ACI882_002284 [Reinekea sp.]